LRGRFPSTSLPLRYIVHILLESLPHVVKNEAETVNEMITIAFSALRWQHKYDILSVVVLEESTVCTRDAFRLEMFGWSH
jgi:hypothetical protein